MPSSSQQPAVQETSLSADASPYSRTNQLFDGVGARNYGSVATPNVLATPKPTSATSRVVAPDLLRGLILPLMSLDHAALFMGAWLHGTPKQTEAAGTVFTQWNFDSAWYSRTLSHICAPGFFFLLGMGTVYFHRSRAKIGWTKARLAKHFGIRAVALTAVSELMGQTMMRGRHVVIINIVLIGLAVDYLLTGLLCLLVNETETAVAKWIDTVFASKDAEERNALLDNENQQSGVEEQASAGSKSLSFWLHNVVLAMLTYVTIFWNVWLHPTHGHCNTTSSHPSSLSVSISTQMLALASKPVEGGPTRSERMSRFGAWFDFWFYPVQNEWVMSGFPPLGWISFCLFGMLYARVMLHKRWTPQAVIVGNAGVGVLLAALFVATRLLHFGNLSEGCLRMPEHVAHAHKNQYLASFKSFFYITKYPPSPSFFALTMAINFGLLALFTALPPTVVSRIPGLMNYGGSALFFYVAHMYLYLLLSIPVRYWFEHELADKPPNPWERTKGTGASAPFWITWMLGLLMLSPMCRAYGKFKASKSTDSIWRFF